MAGGGGQSEAPARRICPSRPRLAASAVHQGCPPHLPPFPPTGPGDLGAELASPTRTVPARASKRRRFANHTKRLTVAFGVALGVSSLVLRRSGFRRFDPPGLPRVSLSLSLSLPLSRRCAGVAQASGVSGRLLGPESLAASESSECHAAGRRPGRRESPGRVASPSRCRPSTRLPGNLGQVAGDPSLPACRT